MRDEEMEDDQTILMGGRGGGSPRLLLSEKGRGEHSEHERTSKLPQIETPFSFSQGSKEQV